MNWLQLVLALIQMAPSVIQAIQQAETTLGPGNGPAKKAMVLAPLAATADTPPEVTNGVSNMIDTIVSAINTKSKPAAK